MAQQPLVEGEKSKLLAVRLPERLSVAIDLVAKERGVSRSSLARAFLEAAVNDLQEDAA